MTPQSYQRVSSQVQRDELILGHLSLVRHILGRMTSQLPPGVDLENLESAGTLGLVEAANRFESDRGVQFKTFAYTRIRGAIYDELRRNSPFSQDLLEKVTKIRRLLQTIPPPASVATLAKHSGLDEDDVVECLAAIRLSRVVSWNDVADQGRGADPDAANRPDARIEEDERRRLLVDTIAQLPEMERLAITLYYMEELRLKEIGQVMNLSESRVSRLLKAARHRLEEAIRSRECSASKGREAP